MLSDPIADALTRIRNASIRLHKQVVVPHSGIVFSILEVMRKFGYVGEIKTYKEKGTIRKWISVNLLYDDGVSRIRRLVRISKPSLRVYSGYKELNRHVGGYGIYIVSTPRGIMTGKDAKHKKLGGEIICSVY